MKKISIYEESLFDKEDPDKKGYSLEEFDIYTTESFRFSLRKNLTNNKYELYRQYHETGNEKIIFSSEDFTKAIKELNKELKKKGMKLRMKPKPKNEKKETEAMSDEDFEFLKSVIEGDPIIFENQREISYYDPNTNNFIPFQPEDFGITEKEWNLIAIAFAKIGSEFEARYGEYLTKELFQQLIKIIQEKIQETDFTNPKNRTKIVFQLKDWEENQETKE